MAKSTVVPFDLPSEFLPDVKGGADLCDDGYALTAFDLESLRDLLDLRN